MAFASPLTRLQGGFETATYRFELDGAPANLSGPIVLRLYPQFYGTRNAIWESTVQNVLAGEGYPVARAHILCTDVSVLDGAFFIMDYLPGRPLAAAPPESVPRLLGETHADLHNIAPPNRSVCPYATATFIHSTSCSTMAKSPVSSIGPVLRTQIPPMMLVIRWC